MDYAGETTPNDRRAENHPRVWCSDGPSPLNPPRAGSKSYVRGSRRSDGGPAVPGGTGQEEGGARGAPEASRPPPIREPRPSQTVALPAGENRPQAASVGSQERIAAAGKGPASRTGQPRVSWYGLPPKAQIVCFSQTLVLGRSSVPARPTEHPYLQVST